MNSIEKFLIDNMLKEISGEFGVEITFRRTAWDGVTESYVVNVNMFGHAEVLHRVNADAELLRKDIKAFIYNKCISICIDEMLKPYHYDIRDEWVKVREFISRSGASGIVKHWKAIMRDSFDYITVVHNLHERM